MCAFDAFVVLFLQIDVEIVVVCTKHNDDIDEVRVERVGEVDE